MGGQLGEISLVKGFYKFNDIPEEALRNNLLYRFSIILHTDYPDELNMVFRDDIYFLLLPDVLNMTDYSTFSIELDFNKSLNSFNELKLVIAENENEDKEPPPFIRVYDNNNELMCLCVTEYWTLVGGEMPYSDSYTISLYSKEDFSSLFQRSCLRTCLNSKINIREIIDSERFYVNQHTFSLSKF
jgi:hypothetical protein